MFILTEALKIPFFLQTEKHTHVLHITYKEIQQRIKKNEIGITFNFVIKQYIFLNIQQKALLRCYGMKYQHDPLK